MEGTITVIALKSAPKIENLTMEIETSRDPIYDQISDYCISLRSGSDTDP
jgi:hypothetical protein